MEKLADVSELDRTKGTLFAVSLSKGPSARATKAAARAASLAPILSQIEAEGRRSLNAIARALTAEGIPTAAGTTNWTPAGVARVKAKLAT
jgi:hypothetical protein